MQSKVRVVILHKRTIMRQKRPSNDAPRVRLTSCHKSRSSFE